MSLDKAKEFLQKFYKDPQLLAKVQETYINSLLKVAKEYGYDLTKEDLDAAAQEVNVQMSKLTSQR